MAAHKHAWLEKEYKVEVDRRLNQVECTHRLDETFRVMGEFGGSKDARMTSCCRTNITCCMTLTCHSEYGFSRDKRADSWRELHLNRAEEASQFV